MPGDDRNTSQFDLIISTEDNNSAQGRVVSKHLSAGRLPRCNDAKVMLSDWTAKSVKIELTGATCNGTTKLGIKNNTLRGRIKVRGEGMSYLKFKKVAED